MATNGRGRPSSNGNGKEVTRYTFDVAERGVPETGHTDLLPDGEQVISVPMDNGWTEAIQVGHLPEQPGQSVLVDMDPVVDPMLFWSGKRSRRDVPVLPLQRNEIITESRIAQIIERVRARMSPGAYQPDLWMEMERALREGDRQQRAEWLTHEEGWRNKLICGDSLQVMESLLQYEGLRGKVQMIYIDPPYGIKYDSNFQQRVDSTRNDDKDLADDVLTIKAFRDTWALGVHSYLSYLQERLYLCRELLSESGSVFVQIGDENAHLIRAVLDEVFGAGNFVADIAFMKVAGRGSSFLDSVFDHLLWYARDRSQAKYRPIYAPRRRGTVDAQYNMIQLADGTSRKLTSAELSGDEPIPPGDRFMSDNLLSQGETRSGVNEFVYGDRSYRPSPGYHWKVAIEGLTQLAQKGRLIQVGNWLKYKRFLADFGVVELNNVWTDTIPSTFSQDKLYVVQTPAKVIARCIYMTTDPGDLVFDLTCGSGTTAHAAEMTARRWITCDTSRVAINVARRRLLSAVFDRYRTRAGTLTSGLVYKTVSRATLKSLAYDLEPEKVELVDQPEVDRSMIRVTGPFDIMSLGRYSAEDWKGYVNDGGALENYIGVICRLYHRGAAVQSGAGFVHAIVETEGESRFALSVGPLSGRVTPRQITDAVENAAGLGINEIHVLGWAFEANVGEIVSQLAEQGKAQVRLVMIRPDTLAEGLKVTKPEMLFSPLTLPDVQVTITSGKDGQPEARVTLNGVGIFNRKRRITEYHAADDGYVAAWYLDEDYDGDCFVDCQMFFDFGKAPNLRAALKADIDPEEYKLQLTSQPFPIPQRKEPRRIAVKVVDVYGNEVTLVRDLA